MNPMMLQFPPFLVDEAGYRAGNVEVTAKSPSGRILPLKINGDTTNFVPDEIGDWQISVTSNGSPIKGSPFSVRVYDGTRVKVFGLEGGDDGVPVSFYIDSTKAGNGKLSVEVTKENGQNIQASISKSGQNQKVTFNPTGPGIYNIRVFFSTVEVPGSPFQVTILDTKSISASGRGLSSALAGKVATFRVDTGKAKDTSCSVAVKILSPNGSPVTSYAKPIGAGIYEIDYIPDEIGKYLAIVDYGGKAIPGSPFTVDVMSLKNVKVTKLTTNVVVNKQACLEFDAKDTGDEEPVVRVNDDRHSVDLRNLDDRKYRATFIPKVLGHYYVDVFLYGEPIPGSPFLVNCHDGRDVYTSLENCNKGIVKYPMKFDIETRPYEGEVKVLVYSPQRKLTQCRLNKITETSYTAEFIPLELGDYEVQITFEDSPIIGSPFMVPIANPGGVLLSMKTRSLILGQTFTMTADTTKSGPGDLGVRATGPSGPVHIEGTLLSAGMYNVIFTPEEPGNYYIDVDFDCKPLPESPIVLTVNDLSNIEVSGHECGLVRVGTTKNIHVKTVNAGVANLQAKLTSPGNASVPLTISGSSKTGFDLCINPKNAGPHEIDLTYGGVPIPVSPIVFMAFDPLKIKVIGINDGVIGKMSTFLIDLNNSGEGELEVVVTSSNGKPIVNEVNVLNPGKLEVSFVPIEGGPHFVDITFNKECVSGSPFKLKVLDASRIQVLGDGIEKVPVNQVAQFFLQGQDIKASDIEVQVKSLQSSRGIISHVSDSGNNKVKVEYTPKSVGEHEVCIDYMGCPVAGSPFIVSVWDVSKVYVSGLTQGFVGAESVFNIEMKDAGDGTVEISILDPSGQLIPNNVTSSYPGCIQVQYVPVMSGMHNVMVEFNGARVNGTPRQISVVDRNNVSVKGDGIGPVQCNAYTNFTITAPDATLKDLKVNIIDPMGREVSSNIVERGNNFRVDYTPTSIGCYSIEVSCFNCPVRGSPFCAEVWDHRKAVLTNHCDLRHACLKSSFKVLVGDAGNGIVEACITDPSNNLVPNQMVSVDPGVIEVFFTPNKHGEYLANVTFNEKAVSGSPFKFNVIDKDKISWKLPSNGYVPVKQVACVVVKAPLARMGDVEFQIIGPNEAEVGTNVSEQGNNTFKVDFTPDVAGDFRLAMKYFDCPMPLACIKAWDISKVYVGCIKPGKVGYENNFEVDVRDAGEGSFEVSIENDRSQLVENSVTADSRVKGLYRVTTIPQNPCLHKVNVLFNGCHVRGSPFQMAVCDPNEIVVEGEGLHMVRCNRPTGFHISGVEALREDVHCYIESPSGNEVKCKVTNGPFGKFDCHYTPNETGQHLIFIKYYDEAVKDSPFMALCWDPAKIRVECIRPSIVGRPNSFMVNASEAGPGSVEVLITSKGELVKSTARNFAEEGIVEVVFTPVNVEPHLVNVKFNGEVVPGSPFTALVLDGSQASARGTGLETVRVGEPARFTVTANAVGCDAELEVQVTSPSGVSLPCRIEGSYGSGYIVEYMPVDAGEHCVKVWYADAEIKGSPFRPRAFDPDRVVLLDRAPFCCLNRPTSFKIDATRAGPGNVSVIVLGGRSRPHVDLHNSNGLYTATFTPMEPVVHEISVLFNDFEIYGSPFGCSVLDEKQMRIIWESHGPRPVGAPVNFSIDSKNRFDLPLSAYVVDPQGRNIDSFQEVVGDMFNLEFVPSMVGTYQIHVNYGCDAVPGSPFRCDTFDIEGVRVKDLSEGGCIGDDVFFTVDTLEAGEGVVDVNVTCKGREVFVGREKFSNKYRYSFKADSPDDYNVEIFFNKFPLPGSPFIYRVENPACNLSLKSGNDNCPVGVGNLVWAVLVPPSGVKLHSNDCNVDVVGPYDDAILPSRKSLMSNGNLKIEYTSTIIGLHAIRVFYGGQEVTGSPCLTQIFDPNGVVIEGTDTGEVGKEVVLDVDVVEAGEANLEVKVTRPDNTKEIFRIDNEEYGFRISYTPTQPGVYRVDMNYGCLNVPGCPIRQEIRSSYNATACGDGLIKGTVGKLSSFTVDTKGQPGDLYVSIRDSQGELDAIVNSLPDGNFRVEYEPIAAGDHSVEIYYNNQLVQCVFHPKVTDPMAVCIMDSDSCWSQDDTLYVRINQLKSIPFDTSNAGPGKLTATIEGPNSDLIRPDIIAYPNGASIKFLPKHHGNYVIRVYYNDAPTRVFPIIAICQPEVVDVVLPPMMENCHLNEHGYFHEHNCYPESLSSFNAHHDHEMIRPVHEYPLFEAPSSSESDSDDDGYRPYKSNVYQNTQTPLAMIEAPCKTCSNCNNCGGFIAAPLIDPTLPPRIENIYVEEQKNYPYEVNANHLSHNIDRRPACHCSHPEPIFIQQPPVMMPVQCPQCPPAVPCPKCHSRDCIKVHHHKHHKHIEQNFINPAPIIIQQPPPPPPPPSQPIFIQEVVPPPPQTILVDFGKQEMPNPAPIVDENLVRLSGSGVSTVRCRDPATFIIDGKLAGPGIPSVRLTGLNDEVAVRVEAIDRQVYQCSYVAMQPGAYLLTVWWDNRQIPGSPFRVTVLPCCDPSHVVLRADGLANCHLNSENLVFVDARNAGRGVLKASLQGPTRYHHCDIGDRGDGTYEILFKPLEVGNYQLGVLYDEIHIPGSVFSFQVGCGVDASKVRVSGEGIKSGILATFDSRFVIDTQGAGQGQLNVKVRGKKGSFQVQMSKDPTRKRVVLCQYNPTEVGEYYVNILWSGVHVPGSPFKVNIMDTLEELSSLQSSIVAVPSYYGYATSDLSSGLQFM